jgi:pyridoxal phosphate enzyme (YggS family)
VVQTIDRVEVARALVGRTGGAVHGLMQVNVTRDPAKSGVSPERAAELAAQLAGVTGFSLEGLMTIGPADADASASRAAFRELRRLFDELRAMGYERLADLSMGMSDDYTAAIAEGATYVRLGTAIFGQRPTAARGNQR